MPAGIAGTAVNQQHARPIEMAIVRMSQRLEEADKVTALLDERLSGVTREDTPEPADPRVRTSEGSQAPQCSIHQELERQEAHLVHIIARCNSLVERLQL